MKPFKILLFNLCYCLGLTGSVSNYSLRSYRFIYCSKNIQKAVIEKIKSIIKKQNPDLCCFIEIHQGSKFLNRLNQFEILTPQNYKFHDIDSKYGKTVKSLPLPHFKKQSNAFIAKQNLVFKKHFFRRGIKKLIYEIQLNPQTHLFMTHFALNKRTRKKQLKELGDLIGTKERVILCGDFNIKKYDELTDLLQNNNLKIVNRLRDKTFPSHKPKRLLDLFLCSRDIKVRKFRVLKNVKISDHLPVLIEIEI